LLEDTEFELFELIMRGKVADEDGALLLWEVTIVIFNEGLLEGELVVEVTKLDCAYALLDEEVFEITAFEFEEELVVTSSGKVLTGPSLYFPLYLSPL